MRYVFDTGPLMLYFAGHQEAKKLVTSCRKNNSGYVPSQVLLEFYYLQWRQFGQRTATYRYQTILSSHLEVVDLPQDQFATAAKFKATKPTFSLVDSNVFALAKQLGATIITTEEPLTKEKGVKGKKLDY